MAGTSFRIWQVRPSAYGRYVDGDSSIVASPAPFVLIPVIMIVMPFVLILVIVIIMP